MGGRQDNHKSGPIRFQLRTNWPMPDKPEASGSALALHLPCSGSHFLAARRARPGKCRQVQASAGRASRGANPHQPEQAVEVDQKWSFDNENMGHIYLLLLFPRHVCTVFTHLSAEVKYSANP